MEKIKGVLTLAFLFVPVIGLLICCHAVTCMSAGDPFAAKLIIGILTMGGFIPVAHFVGGY